MQLFSQWMTNTTYTVKVQWRLTGDAITAVGETDILSNEYSSANIVDCNGKVLMPGLINAHTHVPMTLLRGLADDLRLDVWLMGYMMPVEREYVSPDFVQLGTSIGLCRDDPQRGNLFCGYVLF